MAATQLNLSFESPQFDTIKELINHVVYSCGRQQKYIAAELNWSPSQFAHILSGDDGRSFPAEKLPDLIRITAPTGHLIIYWLIDRFLSDGASRRDRALSVVEAMLPELLRAVEDLKK